MVGTGVSITGGNGFDGCLVDIGELGDAKGLEVGDCVFLEFFLPFPFPGVTFPVGAFVFLEFLSSFPFPGVPFPVGYFVFLEFLLLFPFPVPCPAGRCVGTGAGVGTAGGPGFGVAVGTGEGKLDGNRLCCAEGISERG